MKEYLISNYRSIRKRTVRIVEHIPANMMSSDPINDKFTIGDIARHIILLERDFYLPIMKGRRSMYRGCGIEEAPTKEILLGIYNNQTMKMMDFLENANDEFYSSAVKGPMGEIALQKWMTLMFEHEIHHRGQIYILLSKQGIEVPQIFNMKSEELINE